VRTRQWLTNLTEGLRAIFAGVWLGVLRPEELDALDERHHMTSPFARAEYSRRGLFAWERRCLERFPPKGRILVVAAGGGREMLALTRIGYQVDGCECNPLLAAVANKVLAEEGGSVHVAARDSLVAPRPPYDAVVVGWGAYALMRSRASRIRFLESVKRVVIPNAPMVMSFPVRAGRARGLRLTWALANVFRRVGAREPIELGDTLGSYAIHYFNRAELELEVRQAGYEIELYDEAEYGHAVCHAPPGDVA
jgi:SAM-dependent methyltransferase